MHEQCAGDSGPTLSLEIIRPQVSRSHIREAFDMGLSPSALACKRQLVSAGIQEGIAVSGGSGAHVDDLVCVCHGSIAMEEMEALCGEAAPLVQQLLLEGACIKRTD